ncbi:20100_t:CDS:2, partial [Racocetra fulgida]
MNYEFIQKFQELSLDMGSNNNQDSLEFGIKKFIIDTKTPFYAKISEQCAIINGMVYFYLRTDKGVKWFFLTSLSNTYNEHLPKGLDFKSSKNENEVITNLIKNAYQIEEEKPINYNILDLFDTAIHFKNTLKIM